MTTLQLERLSAYRIDPILASQVVIVDRAQTVPLGVRFLVPRGVPRLPRSWVTKHNGIGA